MSIYGVFLCTGLLLSGIWLIMRNVNKGQSTANQLSYGDTLKAFWLFLVASVQLIVGAAIAIALVSAALAAVGYCLGLGLAAAH